MSICTTVLKILSLVHCYSSNVFFSLGRSNVTFDGFSSGSGEIWLQSVMCRAYNLLLSDCQLRFNIPVNEACTHANDAGVLCGKIN